MNPSKEQQELMLQIQQVDFALVELTLYLDTHPNDAQAIQQFNELTAQSKKLKHQYEQAFGPLLQFGGSFSSYPWNWNKAPWPWQM